MYLARAAGRATAVNSARVTPGGFAWGSHARRGAPIHNEKRGAVRMMSATRWS
jgi:hypothetical protein